MQTARFVEALRADLEAIAAIGDERTADAVRRLSHALTASAGLRLLDALGEAALELTAQLPSGRVEVRLGGGQEAELVYVEEERQRPAPADEENSAARITLRLPERLKASVERAAAAEGVSVNTWLVRAIARAVDGGSQGFARRRPGSRLTGFGQG